jgi:hypothetical protein
VVYDCALQMVGIVTIRFVGEGAAARVAVEYGREPFLVE